MAEDIKIQKLALMKMLEAKQVADMAREEHERGPVLSLFNQLAPFEFAADYPAYTGDKQVDDYLMNNKDKLDPENKYLGRMLWHDPGFRNTIEEDELQEAAANQYLKTGSMLRNNRIKEILGK